MKITILTGCLLSLGLMGCSQNPVKSSVERHKLSAEEQAIQGVNALYTQSSFDYASQIKFEFSNPATAGNPANSNQIKPGELDPLMQKKLDQFFATEKIQLKAQEKQALYQAMSEQQQVVQASSMSSRLQKFSANLLNDLDLSLNGSVHWSQKQASMNLQLRYAKPTLLVQAQVPMVLDLQDHKFYSNFFALMPFLVNRDSQADYAYIDLSKYRDRLQRINGRAGMQFLQELSAVPYRLAAASELSRIAVTAQERQQGVVEKIRLQSTLVESLLQTTLFLQVNEQHLLGNILHLPNADERSLSLNASLQKGIQAANARATNSSATLEPNEVEHYQELLSEYWQQLTEQQEATCAECANEDAAPLFPAEVTAAEEAEPAQSEQTTEAFDFAKCQQLMTAAQPIVSGEAYRCLNVYDLDVLQPDDAAVQAALPVIRQEQLVQLKQRFKAYNTGKLVTAEQFKVLWEQHQPEIQAYLDTEKTSMQSVVELGLDAEGRMLSLHNQFDVPELTPQQQLRIQVNTQVSRYGQASAIDQQALKRAKPIAEVVKGSALEGLLGNVLKRSGLDDAAQSKVDDSLTFDQQLQQLAAKIYTQKQDYLTTYHAVFLAFLAQQQPHWVQHFSTQALTDIASLHAYRYASEKDLVRTAQLAQQQILWEQRQHFTEDSYQSRLGMQTAALVERVIQQQQQKNSLKQLKQHYPKPEQQFSALYVQAYQQTYHYDRDNTPAELKQVAGILGRAYAAQQKRTLGPESFGGLKLSDEVWVDMELIPVVFGQLEEK